MVNVDSIDSRFKDLVEFASNKFLPLSASDDHALSTISDIYGKKCFCSKIVPDESPFPFLPWLPE